MIVYSEVETRPVSTVQYVYSAIKSRIIRGELAPGEKIDQDALASDLGVSRMPVRTALDKLEVEDFVEILAHRGARVTEISLTEIYELLKIREPLEGMVTFEASQRMTKELLRSLESLESEMEDAAAKDDTIKVLEVNRRFHFGIYEAAEMPSTLRILNGLWDKVDRYYHITVTLPGQLPTAIREHRLLIHALRGGKHAEAQELMCNHIRKPMTHLAEVLPTLNS